MNTGQSILIENEGGFASGYKFDTEIYSQCEELKGYLNARANPARIDLVDSLCRDHTQITILRTLQVTAAKRGKGIGAELLKQFIEQSSTGVVVLICDLNEPQQSGFKLESFYSKYGFKSIFDGSDGPIMLLNK